jgi:hypothetical protein
MSVPRRSDPGPRSRLQHTLGLAQCNSPTLPTAVPPTPSEPGPAGRRAAQLGSEAGRSHARGFVTARSGEPQPGSWRADARSGGDEKRTLLRQPPSPATTAQQVSTTRVRNQQSTSHSQACHTVLRPSCAWDNCSATPASPPPTNTPPPGRRPHGGWLLPGVHRDRQPRPHRPPSLEQVLDQLRPRDTLVVWNLTGWAGPCATWSTWNRGRDIGLRAATALKSVWVDVVSVETADVPMPRFRPVPGDYGPRSVRTQDRRLVSDPMVQSQAANRPRRLDLPAARMATVKEGADHEQRWLRRDPKQVQEWLRQNNLIYGGLIAIGVAMVQPFLTAASLDLSATICIVAFSVAIPLLAAPLLINRQEAFRRRATKSVLVAIAQVVAQVCAFVGWSPASGTSSGSLGWGCWQAGSWRWRFTRQATCAWNETRNLPPRKPRNPATPRHSPLRTGAPPVRVGCARPARPPGLPDSHTSGHSG